MLNRYCLAVVAAALMAALPLTTSAAVQDKVDEDALCASLSRVAETIMANRQAGQTMRKAMEIANTEPQAAGVVGAIVKMAYALPRYSTPSARQDTITEFGNEVMRMCYNRTGK